MKLRGHHLICLHFFSGEGYDAAFIENLRNVISVTEESTAQVHNGADAVCAKCPSLQVDRCSYSALAEQEIADLDSRALRLLNLSHGQHVGWTDIRNMLPSIFHEWYMKSCNSCDWKWACENNKLYLELNKQLIAESPESSA